MNAFRSPVMALAMLLGTLALAGCSSSPSESNFQAAIQRNFDQHGRVCMFTSNYPSPDKAFDFYGDNEMSHALASAGLFTATVYKQLPAEKASFFSAAMPARTLYKYKLTALGTKYYSTKTECFGFKRHVLAVTNYTKVDNRDYQVDFSYEYVVPKWANDPALVNTAKQMLLDGNYQAYLQSHGKPMKDQAYVTLTHNGWRAHLPF